MIPYARTKHSMREIHGHRVHQLSPMPEPRRRHVQDWALYAVAVIAVAVLLLLSGRASAATLSETLWIAIVPAMNYRPTVVLERFTDATACAQFASRVKAQAGDGVVCVIADKVYRP